MKKKIFISTISALVLVLSLTTALCACNTTNSEVGANNLVIEQTVTEGLELSFGEAIVASDGTTSQTITATVKPESAYNTSVIWSIAWATTNSDNISNYLTLAHDGNTATITCLQPFSKQAIVKAVSSVNSVVFAQATIDYSKKLTNASIDNLYNSTIQTGDGLIMLSGGSTTLYDIQDSRYETHDHLQMMFNMSYTYGIGSVDCTAKVYYVSVSLTDEAKQVARDCELTFDDERVALTGSLEGGYDIGNVLDKLIVGFDPTNSSMANFCLQMVGETIIEITIHFDNGLECSTTLDFYIAEGVIIEPQSVALTASELVF